MRAGRRRHRLIIERPVTTRDVVSGDEVVTWAPFAEVWAGIEPMKGREAQVANQIQADGDTLIVLLWSPLLDGITAKHRCRHVPAGRTETIYNIASPPIHTKMGRREIQLVCRAGLNRG